ncbi:MAG: hypothetical protein NC412_02915 [Roseburia sp.]|nr:hypothetical protein [Roseburia sp.]MCM1278713.1 hypothetical protein [Robinsoniella sp.]
MKAEGSSQRELFSNNSEKVFVDGKSYEKIRLLGHGKGGYSYLAWDGERNCVLKQIHHEPCSYYQFDDKIQAEQDDYKRLVETGIRIPKMLAIEKEKEIIIKEYIEGPTIYELVLSERMKEEYLLQVREMSKRVYSFGLNIDYFPTNFVVQEGKIYYVDYECNEYMEQWDFENWGVKYWSKTREFMEYVESPCR